MLSGPPTSHVTSDPGAGSAPIPTRLRSTRRMSGDLREQLGLGADVDRLFQAIGGLLARCPDADDAVLRPLMRTVVAEARGAGLYAEMLLRLLKESWRSLPEPTSSMARLAHFEALDRVVSLCIREFYRSDG